MTDSVLIERYKSLPNDYQSLITSDFAFELSNGLAGTYNLSSEQQLALEEGITLLLLFIFSEIDLVNFLVNEFLVSEQIAKELVYTVTACLPNVTFTTDSEVSLDTEIIETQQILNSMPAEPPVYQSSQDAILNQIPTPPSVPAAPATPQPPRWETQ